MKNKKTKIIIIVTIVIILAILGTIFGCIDVNRLKKGQNPIFCINTQIMRDGGTKVYVGLGYKIIDFNTETGYDEIKVGLWGIRYEDYIDEIKEYQENLKKQEESKEENQNEKNSQNIFYAKILEVNEKSILVEPFKNEEIRKSSDKISIGIENTSEYILDENIRVEFNGEINESYPATVEANNIEKIDFDDFEIKFTPNELEESEKIINKDESNISDFDIYAHKGDVTITINEEDYTLKDALESNKITPDEIINRAKQEAEDGKVEEETYKLERGTIYRYNDYAIILLYNSDKTMMAMYIGEPNSEMEEFVQIVY